MLKYIFPQQCQPYSNRSPNWYNRFHTHLTLGPSHTHASAPGLSANSKRTSASVSEQAAKWRWKERTTAYDRATANTSPQPRT